MERGRRHCQERSVRSKPTAAGRGRRPTCVASDTLERGAGGGPPAGRLSVREEVRPQPRASELLR